MNGKITFKTIISLGALLSLIAFVTGCASPRTHVTEEQKFIQLHHVANTGADLNLKRGDAIAMACAKCKTVLYADVNRPRTKFFTPLEHRHYCPGCKSVITTTRDGFRVTEQVKHTCSFCGSDSVFCCATTRAAGPTEGMSQ